MTGNGGLWYENKQCVYKKCNHLFICTGNITPLVGRSSVSPAPLCSDQSKLSAYARTKLRHARARDTCLLVAHVARPQVQRMDNSAGLVVHCWFGLKIPKTGFLISVWLFILLDFSIDLTHRAKFQPVKYFRRILPARKSPTMIPGGCVCHSYDRQNAPLIIKNSDSIAVKDDACARSDCDKYCIVFTVAGTGRTLNRTTSYSGSHGSRLTVTTGHPLA